jgi:HD-like signal output (HDOD) protein
MTDDRPSILFVDDEPNVIAAIRRLFHHRRPSWAMHFATSGTEALERIAELGGIDIVVSDMRMPGMDGSALLGEVARRYPDSARFILSGQSDMEAMFRAIGPCHQYLSKPLDGAKLESRIDQSVALRRRITPTLRSALARLQYVPSLPSVYRDLAVELAAGHPRPERIDAIISHDPGIAAKVLQVANSPYFNRAREARTPSQAVGFLGFDLVKALVLTCGAAGAFSRIGGSGLVAAAVVAHSVDIAALAGALMRAAGGGPAEIDEASGAGLLHDIGMLLLAENRPDTYRQVLDDRRRGGQPLEDIERAAFGVGHADAGAFLLGTWGLGDGIVEAVALHHERLLSLTRIDRPVDAVAVASQLVSERHGPPFPLAPGQTVETCLPDAVNEEQLTAWRRLRDQVLADGDGR